VAFWDLFRFWVAGLGIVGLSDEAGGSARGSVQLAWDGGEERG
jgi:hypothetical protein